MDVDTSNSTLARTDRLFAWLGQRFKPSEPRTIGGRVTPGDEDEVVCTGVDASMQTGSRTVEAATQTSIQDFRETDPDFCTAIDGSDVTAVFFCRCANCTRVQDTMFTSGVEGIV